MPKAKKKPWSLLIVGYFELKRQYVHISKLLTLYYVYKVDNNTPGHGSTGSGSRRSSVYPTTSRRCSEAVATYAATGDLHAVAEVLVKDTAQDIPEDDDFVMPPEKERKRMVLLISCIGLTMTFMAAIMVGITLGLSHILHKEGN